MEHDLPREFLYESKREEPKGPVQHKQFQARYPLKFPEKSVAERWKAWLETMDR